MWRWLRRHLRWGWLLGALVFLFGIPGAFDDGAAWWGWLGSGSALTPYAVAILGLLVVVGTGIAVFTEPRRRRKAANEREARRMLSESKFWPDGPDYGSPPLRFKPTPIPGEAAGTRTPEPGIIGAAFARGNRDLVHRQDLEQERRQAAERRSFAAGLGELHERGSALLKLIESVLTPYEQVTAEGKSQHPRKLVDAWEAKAYDFIAAQRPDIAPLVRSEYALPDELRRDLKPHERNAYHPVNVQLSLRRRLYRLEEILRRSDL